MFRRLFCKHDWELLDVGHYTDDSLGYTEWTQYLYVCKKCLKKKKIKTN
jgi:hypothetical protein